jgi:peptidase E
MRVCYVPTATGDADRAIEACTARFAQHPAQVELSALRLFTQPSVPDVRAHLLAQDVILVEGGSVVNLMAVWRAHGLPPILRECWDRGVVLAGTSAGSLCWHTGGPTDSYRDALDPFTDGLALVPYSNGVHDDLPDQPRRETYRRMVADGGLPAGYATEDGVALHYLGTELHEAVSVLPGKRAWYVEPADSGHYTEAPVTPRLI